MNPGQGPRSRCWPRLVAFHKNRTNARTNNSDAGKRSPALALPPGSRTQEAYDDHQGCGGTQNPDINHMIREKGLGARVRMRLHHVVNLGTRSRDALAAHRLERHQTRPPLGRRPFIRLGCGRAAVKSE